MKTLTRIGLVCLCLVLIGAIFPPLTTHWQASLIAADRTGGPLPPDTALVHAVSERIPKGMRVVAVRPLKRSNRLTPGDVVDVVWVAIQPEPFADAVLKRVKVFAVSSTDDPHGSPQNSVVSLVVTAEDAQKLALAAEMGKILLLSSGSDGVAGEEPLSQEAAMLEIRLKQLGSQLTPAHPKMLAIKARIAALAEYQSSVAKAKDAIEKSERKERLAEFEQVLRQVVPSATVVTLHFSNGVLLSGLVSGSKDESVIIQIAEHYFPHVVNNLTVAKATTGDRPFGQRIPSSGQAQSLSSLLLEDTKPLGTELRGLHEDVRELRRDVNRLIAILEGRDKEQ